MYSYTISLTSALDAAALPQGKARYPLYRRLGGPKWQVWKGEGKLVSHRESIPGPPSPQQVAIPTELSRLTDTKWSTAVNSTHQTFYHWGQSPRYPLGRPLNQSACFYEEINLLFLPGFEPQIARPVAYLIPVRFRYSLFKRFMNYRHQS